MESRRAHKVADLIRDEISAMLLKELKDPRIGFVTITQVEIGPDLRQARVLYSVVGSEAEQESSREGLASATRFIRARLGRRLCLRRVPELFFKYDSSLTTGARLASLIKELEEKAD